MAREATFQRLLDLLMMVFNEEGSYKRCARSPQQFKQRFMQVFDRSCVAFVGSTENSEDWKEHAMT